MLITKKIFLVLMIAFVAIFLFSAKAVSAQVVINEFLANPTTGNKEWVELYNTGSDAISLIGWKLADKAGSEKSLDSLGSISAGGFSVYEYPSGDGWLNNSGQEEIYLKNNEGTTVDSYSYTDAPDEGVTFGRSPDGTGGWVVLDSATPGTPNSLPVPTPTPIPSPTSSPTPTPRPDPTATPGPTSTPTPKTLTPTPNPTKKPTPTSTPASVSILASDSTGQILGGIATVASEQSLPTPEVLGATTRNFSGLLPKVLIGAGFLFLLVSGFFLLLPKIKGYNRFRGKKGEKDEESSDIG